MKQHNFKQGETLWHAYRASARNASDAAAMLGCHPQKTRTQLLQEKHTGLSMQHSQFVEERIFAGGHAIEAKKRPVAVAIIGEGLYPIVGSESLSDEPLATDRGIELSASFDGLTVAQAVNWECKSLNDELRAALPYPGPDGNDAANLPKYHRVQMQQQCMVSGCARVLFTASDGKDDDRHCWFYPSAELAREILAGWRQFDIDLTAYVPTEAAPVAIGRAPETLPALHIEVTGMVTASNLDAFKAHALAVFGGINRVLSTDADFANAETTIKWCGDVETRLAAAKQHALSQTASIDSLFKAIDDITAEARTVRLELNGLVKARKETIRSELVAGGVRALAEHVRGLNTRLGEDFMPAVTADFGGAIKGKRTVDSLRDAINTTLANAKIEASAVADRIQVNMQTLVAAGDAAHFPDSATLVLKEPDYLRAIIAQRIAETQRRIDELRDRSIQAAQAAAPVALPVANVVPLIRAAPAAQPAPATPPTLKLGEIALRLGFALTGDFLKSLGFEPAARDKSAILFHEAEFREICAVLVSHIEAVQAKRAA